MTDDRTIEKLDIRIPSEPALRLLGYGRGRRRPRDSVMSVFRAELELAHELARPCAVLGRCRGGLPGSAYIDPAMPLVAVVCTIGDQLERRVRDLAASGESARATILDAIGSAAAEEVADRCNQLICAMAAFTDYAPDARRSPGYGGWEVSEQALIFDLLRPGEIGVALTDRFSMIPRKSVSFVVPLEGGPLGSAAGERCRHCGLDDCAYKNGVPDALLRSLSDRKGPSE